MGAVAVTSVGFVLLRVEREGPGRDEKVREDERGLFGARDLHGYGCER